MQAQSSFGKKRQSYVIQRTMALGISLIFHPVMLPTFFFIFAAFYIPDLLEPFSTRALMLRFIFLILITTMIIPVAMLSVYFVMSKRKINWSMLYLHNSKERVYPFLHTGIFYAGITYLFYANLHLNNFICSFMGMIAVAVLLAACISAFYKISAHTMALTGLTGYVFLLHFFLPDVDVLIAACVLIFITGLTASCRLFLNAHTPGQILAGCLMGLLCTGISILWF